MRIYLFIIMIFVTSCASRSGDWHNDVKEDEHYSFVPSKLKGNLYVNLNVHMTKKFLMVSFTSSEGKFNYKKGDVIHTVFDGEPMSFRVLRPTDTNILYIGPQNIFVERLTNSKNLKAELTVKESGTHIFEWNVSELKKDFHSKMPIEAIEI